MATLQSEIRAGKPDATVKITATPYSYDRTRMLVTFTIKPKGQPRMRVRKVAPEGLDEAAALAWGKGLEGEVVREIIGERHKEEPATSIIPAPTPAAQPRAIAASAAPRANVLTLATFWDQTFEPRHVHRSKPATRRAYRAIWSKHLKPLLGDFPLDAIDLAAVDKVKGRTAGMQPGSRNQVLRKLRTVLKKARSWGLLKELPLIETDPDPQKDPIIYTDDEATALVSAARDEGREDTAIVLLMLHGGLRVAEVCALRWGDLDLSRAMMRIQHNFSAGEESTPKGGESAWVGMSPDLVASIRALGKPGRRDAYVLTREYKGARTHLTPHAIRYRLNKLQRAAGLEETGPHRLRHTCLTIMARGGFPTWKLQKHARHAKIATTERYVHLAGDDVAQDAAAFWAEKGKGKRRRSSSARHTAPAQARGPRGPKQAKKAKRPEFVVLAAS